MAVDTPAKRAAASMMPMYSVVVSIVPDTLTNKAERTNIGGSYRFSGFIPIETESKDRWLSIGIRQLALS